MSCLWLLAVVLLVAGCDSGGKQAEAPAESSGHLYTGQLQALEDAKEVSAVSRAREAQSRQAMEEGKQ